MKKLLFIVAVAVCSVAASAQKFNMREWACQWRYDGANEMLAANRDKGRVVFVGNSITDNWARMRPEFFSKNHFIGRGISGQTSPQMLMRFRRDVVENGASAVVFLVGTNDIAGNTGPCTLQDIVDNIANMCDIAAAHNIRVLIGSVLPAHRYGWAKDKRPDMEIPKLNKMLQDYAAANNFTYVDYFSAMVDFDPENSNGLPKKYSGDGVHPTVEGYEIMEDIIMKALSQEMSINKAEHAGESLRLMSYNIRNCKGLDEETFNYRRIAEIISSSCVDAVAIQELDSATTRSEGKFVLGEIARMTGLNATYAPAIDYAGGKYGVGMLSLEKPLRYDYVSLPGREERRVLLMVEFKDYIYCCTHLSLTEVDRISSVEIINKAITKFAKGSNKPVFLAGDWNDKPGSKFIVKMSKYFDIVSDTSLNTFPADKPNQTIDYVARWKKSNSSAYVKAIKSSVPFIPVASDHRPVKIIF